MEIKKKGDFSLQIEGNIKNLEDLDKIKNMIDDISPKRGDLIRIDIKNSISMPSSVIGYFLKLIKKDGVTLNISVGDKRLMQLLDDLNLVGVFNVKSV